MIETSARLLRLLALLQARRFWTGAALAEALEVTARTLRRDIEKLRRLGYPIESSGGVAGGYRLGAEARLPPLMLDEEEALAIGISLQAAGEENLVGMEEAAIRALGKIERALPDPVRRRLEGMRQSILPLRRGRSDAAFGVVRVLSEACEDRRTVRFLYRARDQRESLRWVEPHRLVHLGRRWYLVAWDVDRAAWRSFRVDRIAAPVEQGEGFSPRELPDADVETFLTRSASIAAYRMRIVVRLYGAFDQLRPKISPSWGLLEELDEGSCRLETGANAPEAVAVWLASLGVDFEVEEGEAFVDSLRSSAERLLRAADGGLGTRDRGEGERVEGG